MIKKFMQALTDNDILDISFIYQEKRLIRFAINYRTRISGKWCPVYRVDNYHGFLHEQKLWRTKRPIMLEEMGTLKQIQFKYLLQVMENYERYKKAYYEREGRSTE